MPDLSSTVSNFGVGLGSLATLGVGVTWIFNLVKNSRETNQLSQPIFQQAITQRDAESKRADALWDRNNELETKIGELHQQYLSERDTLYKKFEELLDQLMAAREEIASLTAQVTELKNTRTDGAERVPLVTETLTTSVVDTGANVQKVLLTGTN